MARSTYTEQDKARAYVTLTANGGNIKRTARDLDIPPPTLRLWRRGWDTEGGPPAELLETVGEEADTFVAEATRARDLALSKWEAAVKSGDVKGKDLMVGVGILTDKINLAKGLSNKKPEQAQLNATDVAALAGAFVQGALDMARQRAKEVEHIDDDDIVVIEHEQAAKPALGPGTTKG